MLNTAKMEELDRYFDIRPMNAWMRSARVKPVPKYLFGELWREGEVAIMFADTGIGKSALAIQMAEAIARGRSFAPFESTARPAKVLYLDFELSDKQIEMRYTADHEPTQGDMLRRPYSFSQRLCRLELQPDVLRERESVPIEIALRELIQPLIERTGAKVLIVDNITYLKRTADSTREAVPLMKELQRLKRRFGISILVIAHTPKRDAMRPLALNDLQGSKVIANHADNIFAIGQSQRNPLERYIKHIKQRSDELAYDSSYLPVFVLKKIEGNFLGFEHTGFATEADLLSAPARGVDQALIDTIKQLHDGGMTIRQIGEKLCLSKSTAHRYLHMWRPPEFYTFEKCIAEECFGCGRCNGRAAHQRSLADGNIYGHENCPDDCDLCGPKRYRPDDDAADPTLKIISDDHYRDLREWLFAGKSYERPAYPNARRYGVAKARWWPGSERWSESQLGEFVAWRRHAWRTNAPPPAFATQPRE